MSVRTRTKDLAKNKATTVVETKVLDQKFSNQLFIYDVKPKAALHVFKLEILKQVVFSENRETIPTSLKPILVMMTKIVEQLQTSSNVSLFCSLNNAIKQADSPEDCH